MLHVSLFCCFLHIQSFFSFFFFFIFFFFVTRLIHLHIRGITSLLKILCLILFSFYNTTYHSSSSYSFSPQPFYFSSSCSPSSSYLFTSAILQHCWICYVCYCVVVSTYIRVLHLLFLLHHLSIRLHLRLHLYHHHTSSYMWYCVIDEYAVFVSVLCFFRYISSFFFFIVLFIFVVFIFTIHLHICSSKSLLNMLSVLLCCVLCAAYRS